MEKQIAITKLHELQYLLSDRKRLAADISESNAKLSDLEESHTNAIRARKNEIDQQLVTAAVMPTFPTTSDVPGVYNYTKSIQPATIDFKKKAIVHYVILSLSSVFVFFFLRVLFLALIGQLDNPASFGNSLTLLSGIPAITGLLYSLYHLIKKPQQKAYTQQYSEYQESLDQFKKFTGNYIAETEACEANHLQNMKDYESNYKQAVLKYMQALSDHKENMKEFEKFKDRADADYERSRKICLDNLDDTQKKLDICKSQLNEVDILHSKHWEFVDVIVDMLETGRADNCKEALNIAIEQKAQQEHYEAMEELRRQELEEIQEENRRAEQARQEQLLQDRLAREEERRHNLVMEQQQADHNRAMQRAEQERIRADASARAAASRAAQRADSEARAKAWTQCRVCAKQSGCRNPGIPGCGAFVPRR